jgi:hypothetical protein
MDTIRNDIAGSSVFWTISENTDFSQFTNALKSAGFSKHLPERQTEYAALRDALTADQAGAEVFPIKGAATATFEVVSVRRDVDAADTSKRNVFEHRLTAWVTAAGNVQTDTYDSATDDRLTAAFRRNREKVPFHNVSRSLVSIVYALNGVTLRPSGGFYWVPNAAFERWEMVARALELSGPRNRAFALRVVLDEHSAAAMREALANEIARECQEIDTVLSDPQHSLKSAKTQKDKAKQLRRKIESYEHQFTLSLADLKTNLDRAVGIEAVATILESASNGPILTTAAPIEDKPAREMSFGW